MNSVIFELLLKLYLYYPVGLPALSLEYPGRQLYVNQIADKIDKVMEGSNTQWDKLIAGVEEFSKQAKVFDCSYIQFPSLTCEIQLDDCKDSSAFRKIICNVSLLTRHYTVFFYEKLPVAHYAKFAKNEVFQKRGVVYSVSSDGNENILLQQLKKTVEIFFEGYTYAPATLLFNVQVEGVIPYYTDDHDFYQPNQKASLYELLFSNMLHYESFDVVDTSDE